MTTTIEVHAERSGDAAMIETVVSRAYADVPYSDHREHLMIERLRGTNAFIPGLSLVATIEGEPVGHILLTKARILYREHQVETLALAPLSVVPEHQGCGVGRALIEAAHRQATALGFGSVVLVGIPDYYPRFGYEPLGRYSIMLPFQAPPANCMIIALKAGALDGVTGMVEYAAGWLDH